MIDVLFFGKDTTEDRIESLRRIKKFSEAIKLEFGEDVQLSDNYHPIKGFFLKVIVLLENSRIHNYYAWLMGNGWRDCSEVLAEMSKSQKIEDIELLRISADTAVVRYETNILAEFQKD